MFWTIISQHDRRQKRRWDSPEKQRETNSSVNCVRIEKSSLFELPNKRTRQTLNRTVKKTMEKNWFVMWTALAAHAKSKCALWHLQRLQTNRSHMQEHSVSRVGLTKSWIISSCFNCYASEFLLSFLHKRKRTSWAHPFRFREFIKKAFTGNERLIQVYWAIAPSTGERKRERTKAHVIRTHPNWF